VTGAGTARVELYGHAECGLCRTALAVLERLRSELGFELVERDITADAALHRAYFERVPVVCVDGEEVFDFHVDEAVLRALLGRPDPRLAGHDDDLESSDDLR
jgi:glutaredoxin